MSVFDAETRQFVRKFSVILDDDDVSAGTEVFPAGCVCAYPRHNVAVLDN